VGLHARTRVCVYVRPCACVMASQCFDVNYALNRVSIEIHRQCWMYKLFRDCLADIRSNFNYNLYLVNYLRCTALRIGRMVKYMTFYEKNAYKHDLVVLVWHLDSSPMKPIFVLRHCAYGGKIMII
jgi:hypothetical protein